MKKKLLGITLGTLTAAAMLFGCGKDKQTVTDPVEPPKEDEQTDVPPQTEMDDTQTDETQIDDTTGNGKKIALAMPAQSDKRWVDDAEAMKKGLEAKGYQVDVQFADDGPTQQAEQIKGFVEAQVDCIVAAPIDSGELSDAAEAAKNADIPVISYDRLLMDTDAVYYYVAFDRKGIGRMLGQEIEEKAELSKLEDGDYKTIEFFMGSPEEHDAYLTYEGMMEVLQPYLDDGRLVCKTGRTSFEDTSISEELLETAKGWCKNYLAGYYTDEELDICAAVSDSMAYGCKEALQEAGYIADNWPVITGQGCELSACRHILDEIQTASVYLDTSILADRCVTMIDAVLEETEPEINDTEQYHNNVITVPSFLCTPTLVDADNLQEVLIDSGYYTKEQLDEAE